MFDDMTAFFANLIPSKWEAVLLASSSVFCGWMSFALGGIDLSIRWLFVFVVIDYVIGTAASFKNGRWSSKVCFQGLGKKVSIFLIVSLCHGLDVMSGTDFMRSGAIVAYGIAEVGSIFENMDALGYGHLIPSFIRQGLKKIQESKNIKEVGTNDEESMH